MSERADALDARAFLTRGARAYFDHIVLSLGTRSWRRDEVEVLATSIAGRLEAAGVRPGHHVLPLAADLASRLILHRAIVLAGGVQVDGERHPDEARCLAHFNVALDTPQGEARIQRLKAEAPESLAVSAPLVLVPVDPNRYGVAASYRGDYEISYAGALSTYLLGHASRPLLAVGSLGQSVLEALSFLSLVSGRHVRVADEAAAVADAETVVFPLAQLSRLLADPSGRESVHWVAVVETAELAELAPALANLRGPVPKDHLRIVLADGAYGFLAEFDLEAQRWLPFNGVDLAVEDGQGVRRDAGVSGSLRLRAPQAAARHLTEDGRLVRAGTGWAGLALAATIDNGGFLLNPHAGGVAPSWNDEGMLPVDAVNGISVAELLTRGTRWHADKPAIKFQGRILNYGELRSRVSRLRHALHAELGLRAGERVALLLRNGPAFIEAYWAANSLGLILVPANFRLKEAEVRYILQDSGARVLLVDEDLAPLGRAAAKDIHGLERVISVGGSGADAYEALLERAEPLGLEQEQPDDDIAASILYTAGTTGFPKGAVRSNRNAIWFGVLGLPLHTRATPRAAMLLTTPMFHVAGQEPQIIGGMSNAGLAVILRELRVDAVLDHLIKDRVTFMFVPPTVGFELIERVEKLGVAHHLDGFHTWQSASAPLPEALRKRVVAQLPWVELQNALGMTEAGGLASYILRPNDPAAAGTIGRAFPTTDTRVVDKSGREVAPGEPGEIIVRSPQVISSYWNKPEATKSALRGGWLYGGDIGFVDASNNIEIKGRLKDMIISGGENVYSVEVENVLLHVPQLREVAVFGVPDEKWGETVYAAVASKPGETISEQQLIDYCREQIAHYKCPKRVFFLDALPRNALGKVTKFVLQETFQPEGAIS